MTIGFIGLGSMGVGIAGNLLKAGQAVLMGVDLRLEGDSLRVTAADCMSLEQAASDAGAGMRIWLDRTEAVPHIRALLTREGRGRGRVTLLPRIDEEV